MSDVLGSSRLCSQFATLNLAEREGGNEPSHRSAFRAQRTLAIGIFRSVKTLTSMEVQALAETPGTAGTPAAAQLHPEGPLPLRLRSSARAICVAGPSRPVPTYSLRTRREGPIARFAPALLLLVMPRSLQAFCLVWACCL